MVGMAELLPGISGGTIALITGIYERLIDSGAQVVSAVRALVFGPDRRRAAAAQLREVEWMLLISVAVGMVTIVLTLAGLIETLVSENAELARGLFFGLVAASIAVPLRLIPRTPTSWGRRLAGAAVFAVAAVAAFASVSLAGSTVEAEPPLWVVFFAATIAVCALVLPGVSGSFFLLAIGLYSPTLRAVDDRDLGYLAVFAAGALLGLVTIVRVMKWLLDHHRRLTLLAMSGLMLGSLRALWPWQVVPGGDDDHGVGALAAPSEPVLGPILLAVVGALVVVGLILVERAAERRAAERRAAAGLPRVAGLESRPAGSAD